MSKLVLPDPAPKGMEHEKWKAMVDSVIEFISASRVMLQVLNERVKDSEKHRDEQKIKKEEEKVKLEFYADFINSKLNTEQKSRTGLTLLKQHQNSGDKVTEKDNDSRSHNNILNRQGKKFVSRIPRTKSYVEERTKSFGVDRTHNEGIHLGKNHKSRKSDIGYSLIHQRSKTPKGDEKAEC